MKKLLLFMALAIILIPATFSCSDNSGDDTDDSGTRAAETEPVDGDDGTVLDGLPDHDFGKAEFKMAVYKMSYNHSEHFGEEPNGDIYNDALWKRKLYIEDRFNVVLVEDVRDANFCNTGVWNSVRAGDYVYDLVFPVTMNVDQLPSQGLIYNFDDLPYIDLTKPYWDQNLQQYTTLLGKTYFAFNDFDISFYDHTCLLMFSKQMAEDFALEDIYGLVESGKWTMDKMAELMRKVKADPDSQGNGGSWGYLSQPKQVSPGFWIAAGEPTVQYDNDGIPYYAALGNERFVNIITKVYDMMWGEGAWYHNTESTNVVFSKIADFFNDSRALFADNTFGLLSRYRDLDVDFGIIPYPKYDENQDRYYSRVSSGCKFGVVPISNPNPDETSLLMEALACASYNIVIPEYYEKALKVKNVRDEESSGMIDFIFNNRIYDLGDTWYTQTLRDGLFAPMFRDNKYDTLISQLVSIESVMNKLIENTIDAFSK